MTLRVGTSGYSYKEWKGSFYPKDIGAADMLSYYAGKLPAVEINNTFYRLPRASVLETWASAVPEEFRFAIKASRRITHMQRLKDAGDPTSYLIETVQTLGPRLGVILFQLPPNMKKDIPRLRQFLTELSGGPRAVFELRHESWFDEELYDALREHGVALVASDMDDAPEPPVVRTASFGYLRLRRDDYDDDALARWAQRVADQGWDETFVFFKHEDEGAGPALAARFLEIAKGTDLFS